MSAILTLLFAGVMVYLVTVAIRVAYAWFGGTEKGRQAVRDAGLLRTTRIVGRRTASRGWSTARSASVTAASNGRGWWKKWAAARDQRSGAETVPAPAGAPLPPPAPAPRRPAPAHLAGRVLDDAMGPGTALPAGVVPPEWAAICARVGSFEPADDEEYLRHLRDQAAGFGAYAAAVRAGADVLAAETGLDPAVVHAHLELADTTGDCAHDVAMVGRRFCAVYAAVQAAVAEGLILPHKAREFLTGAGG